MANIAVQRIKREFKEVVKSEEVIFMFISKNNSIILSEIMKDL